MGLPRHAVGIGGRGALAPDPSGARGEPGLGRHRGLPDGGADLPRPMGRSVGATERRGRWMMDPSTQGHSPDATVLNGANGERQTVRIAAVGDLHHGTEGQGASRTLLNQLVREAESSADLLLLCGDLTSHGRPDEAKELVNALEGLSIPTLAVLGNHEFDAGGQVEVTRILTERGIRVLDGDAVEIGPIGVAGVK